jgi:hypothetical protein
VGGGENDEGAEKGTTEETALSGFADFATAGNDNDQEAPTNQDSALGSFAVFPNATPEPQQAPNNSGGSEEDPFAFADFSTEASKVAAFESGSTLLGASVVPPCDDDRSDCTGNGVGKKDAQRPRSPYRGQRYGKEEVPRGPKGAVEDADVDVLEDAPKGTCADLDEEEGLSERPRASSVRDRTKNGAFADLLGNIELGKKKQRDQGVDLESMEHAADEALKEEENLEKSVFKRGKDGVITFLGDVGIIGEDGKKIMHEETKEKFLDTRSFMKAVKQKFEHGQL